MTATLQRRLARLEAAAVPPVVARYVVDSWADHRRVSAAFRSSLAFYSPDNPRPPSPVPGAPPEARYSYPEAVAAGIVVETPRFHDLQREAHLDGARRYYAYARLMVEGGDPRSSPSEVSLRSSREAVAAMDGARLPYGAMSTLPALVEVGRTHPDAAAIRAWHDAHVPAEDTPVPH
ncbi:MAG TPA: hypothetical protein VK610_08490 [Rhodothermales bacterium]|nr:hypothetical protein [Rhodothermales bacterium]